MTTDCALIQVGMGQVKVGRQGETLTALLGSCVAIGLVWRAGRCCALAHCLLPQSDPGSAAPGARYVNDALPLMLSMMGVPERDRGELEVILSGGATMLGPAGVSGKIGADNVAAAHACLAGAGLRVTQRDVGGRHGRTVRIDCSTYRVAIAPVEHIVEEAHHAHSHHAHV